VAVITGAARGIGKRTSELMAERGYNLLLNDLRPGARELVGAQQVGADILEVVGDISDEVVVSELAAAARERLGRADVLVNNSGISLIAPAEKLSASEYRRVLEINLVAPFLLARAFNEIFIGESLTQPVELLDSTVPRLGVIQPSLVGARREHLAGKGSKIRIAMVLPKDSTNTA
jgi:NAD(P)-dependent dehydrogenase (short-subunit alcohol dehydrogenase family)